MTVEQPAVVDFIGVETGTGKVVLSIVDHLEWTDVLEHIGLIQEKINRYLAFLDCGEMEYSYPAGKGRSVAIALLHWLPLSDDPRVPTFLAHVSETLRSAGIEFRVEALPERLANEALS